MSGLYVKWLTNTPLTLNQSGIRNSILVGVWMDLTITRATTSLQINTLRKMQPVDGELLQTGFDFPTSTWARSEALKDITAILLTAVTLK